MEENELKVEYEIDGLPIKLTMPIVKEYIVGDKNADITMQEFKLFTELCKARKLNPFLKEAYLIKYGSQPAQLVVAKDAILKTAIKHPQYDGREQGIIVQLPDGKIDMRKGTFRLSNEQIVGGWAKVFRKDISHPTEITVTFNEVAQRKSNGELNSNWSKKGATMVEKVALCRALRETFVDECGGMIDADEAWSNSDLQSNNSKHEEAKKSESSIKYSKLRTELQNLGYDFRALDNNELICLQADIQTQDLQKLSDDELNRLCDVYSKIIEEEKHGINDK